MIYMFYNGNEFNEKELEKEKESVEEEIVEHVSEYDDVEDTDEEPRTLGEFIKKKENPFKLAKQKYDLWRIEKEDEKKEYDEKLKQIRNQKRQEYKQARINAKLKKFTDTQDKKIKWASMTPMERIGKIGNNIGDVLNKIDSSMISNNNNNNQNKRNRYDPTNNFFSQKKMNQLLGNNTKKSKRPKRDTSWENKIKKFL